MNTDKIVRALRKACHDCNPTPCCEYEVLGKEAADLIDCQQAQLAKLQKRIAGEGFPDLETMISKYKTVMLAANEISIETDEEIESLEARLAEAERRERAAVEDLNFACGSQPSASAEYSICDICKHKQGDGSCPKQCFMNSLGASNKWQWRGVVAGEEGRGAERMHTLTVDEMPILRASCNLPPLAKNDFQQGEEGIMSEWIKVTDRLPEDDTSVLTVSWTKYMGRTEPYIRTLHFSKIGEYELEGMKNVFYFRDSEYGDCPVDDVTHWQPLPQPPKGE